MKYGKSKKKKKKLQILKGWKNQPAIVGNNECVGFFQTPSSVQSQCLQRKRGWLVCGSFCSKIITLNVGETHSLWVSCTWRNWTAGWKQSPKHSFPISLLFAKSMFGFSIQRCSLIHSGLPQHVITFFFNLHLRCSVQQFFYTKKMLFVIKLKNSCILFSTKSHFNAQQLKGNQLWITDKRKNIQSIKYLRVYDLLCLELSLEMFFPSAAGVLCLWTAVAWLTKLRRGF